MKCFKCKRRVSSNKLYRIDIVPQGNPYDAGIGYDICDKCEEILEDLLESGAKRKEEQNGC